VISQYRPHQVTQIIASSEQSPSVAREQAISNH
jgi:hypothetical protein